MGPLQTQHRDLDRVDAGDDWQGGQGQGLRPLGLDTTPSVRNAAQHQHRDLDRVDAGDDWKASACGDGLRPLGLDTASAATKPVVFLLDNSA